jgi:hypothetical protein
MAHFAELDENNVVLRVIVVSNEDTHDVNGIENEELGIAFCRRLFGVDTNWKQTSYNNSIRFRYAGIGYTYDQALDAFIPPKPYPSWILDPAVADWKAPVPMPELTPAEIAAGYYYTWDEANQNWELHIPSPQN